MISQRELQSASSRTLYTNVAKSLHEAISRNKSTAFLSHSHHDKELAKGLQTLLWENGWEVYIDWEDSGMPETPNKETANNIKNRISDRNWFLFLATQNSVKSRWCPWEIGYADAVKDHSKIVIVPTEDDYGWYGNEYLQLYRSLNEGYQNNVKKGYAVFKENQNNSGIWINNLY